MIRLIKPPLNIRLQMLYGELIITDSTAVILQLSNGAVLTVNKRDFDREGITEDELFKFDNKQLYDFTKKIINYYNLNECKCYNLKEE